MFGDYINLTIYKFFFIDK